MSPINPKTLFDTETHGTDDGTNWYLASLRTRIDGAFQNESTNNHWYSRDHGSIDRGSEWTAVESSVEMSHPNFRCVRRKASDDIKGFEGALMIGNHGWEPTYTWGEYSNLLDVGAEASEADLLAAGTSAIRSTLPTNPISDLPTAIGELISDGLPELIGSKIKYGTRVSSSSVADEYLNGVFGIQPFFRDLQNFAYAVTRADALIAQYASNSGKLIRRRLNIREENSHDSAVVDNNDGYARFIRPLSYIGLGNWTTPAYGGYSGVREDTLTSSTKTWFSGAYTYYLPEVSIDGSGQLARDLAEARYLYGGITASTVWNLIPYSWAADWFTNAGDVVRNLDAFANDGLVLAWGYVMEQHTVTERRTLRGALLAGTPVEGSQLPSVITTDFSVIRRRRRKATPFGFGFDMGTLSLRQKSILGALAASRGHR